MTAPDLVVDDAGDGPVVVLLHGLTATRDYVVMGSRALERSGHRVLAYDARGHGQSPPGDRYDYPSLAADLGRVLDDHGVERAVLAGASMGAHTLLVYALAHPERVSGVVVVTPAFAPGRDARLEHWDALAEGLRTGGVDGFVAAYDATGPKVPEQWHETVDKVLRQRLSRHEHPDAIADALEQVPRSEPFASLDDLGALQVPAVVVADRDDADPGHPLAVGEAYAAAIPGARLVVEDAGRSPIAWQGGQLSRVIASVVAETTALG